VDVIRVEHNNTYGSSTNKIGLDNTAGVVTGWVTEESWLDSSKEQQIFLFFKTPIMNLVPVLLSFQWVPGGYYLQE
jgi:hypothetical protein